jgi:hypothetical protein
MNNTMKVIETAIDLSELTGFTLFQVKAGWQMSIRPKNEIGWVVKIIPEDQARVILAALEASDLPPISEGSRYIATEVPLKVVDIDALLAEAEGAARALTAVVKSL